MQKARHRQLTITVRKRRLQLFGKLLRSLEGRPRRVVSLIPRTPEPATNRYVRRVGRPCPRSRQRMQVDFRINWQACLERRVVQFLSLLIYQKALVFFSSVRTSAMPRPFDNARGELRFHMLPRNDSCMNESIQNLFVLCGTPAATTTSHNYTISKNGIISTLIPHRPTY